VFFLRKVIDINYWRIREKAANLGPTLIFDSFRGRGQKGCKLLIVYSLLLIVSG
jgi:hypothetical protein